MKNLEVLSPAGSIDSFYSAVNNGADAVYLGLSKFNARAKSQDFNVDNIRNYVKIAHLHGVKVYVTLNTIVIDEEFDHLIKLVKIAVESKVDAFIVQDLGVAKLLKSVFKNIVLHASTQMGIHNLEGALVAQKLGFKRVVLSRETSIEDIKQISKNTNLEIEYFVQGALCVGFSGACYYSSLKHNKSGNRGECLQLCRLCYEAKNKEFIKKGYLLSPTDLCFIDKIQTLVEAGVTSFKIEGRLRRPSYVAVATKEYANAIKIINKTNLDNQSLTEKFKNSKDKLKKVFYRGEYNNGLYLEGEPSFKIINSNYQNHRGVLIGKVIKVKPFKDIFEISIKTFGYQINKNDGLKFVDNNGVETSLGVGSVKGEAKQKNLFYVFSKVKPRENSQVYLTVDSCWEEEVVKTKKKIFFDAVFEGYTRKSPAITLTSGETFIKVVLDEAICEQAKTKAINFEDIKNCLEKTQDTCFCLNNLEVKMQNVFLAKSQLNELRRRAIFALYEKIIENFEQKNCTDIILDTKKLNELLEKETQKEKQDKNNQSFIVVDEKLSLDNLIIEKYKNWSVVLSPTVFSEQILLKMIKRFENLGFKKFYLDLPRVLLYKNKELILKILNILPKHVGIIANNIYGLYFSKDREVIGGASLNIANDVSVKTLKDFGIDNFVRSFEFFAEGFNKGISFEGKPAIMTFVHCPYKTCFGNEECKSCKFDNNLKYISQDGGQYNIRRIRLSGCIFELVDNKIIYAESCQKFIDLR